MTRGTGRLVNRLARETLLWARCGPGETDRRDQENPANPHAGPGGQRGPGILDQIAPGETQREISAAEESEACAAPSHGPQFYLDHLDHLDQASNGAGLPRSTCADPSRTTWTSAPPWDDDQAWCRLLGDEPTVAGRRDIVYAWVEQAGGSADMATVHLPSLPIGLPLARLKAHARAVHLDIREGCPRGGG